MTVGNTWARKAFVFCNYFFLGALALLCVLPLINVLAVSFSNNAAADAGLVKLWPVHFNFKSYEFALHKPEFLRSLWVSAKRIVLGVGLSTLLTVMVAYPLSKDSATFRMRTFYAWMFVFTMLFHGGLIPTYMIVNMTGLTNKLLALIVPESVAVFNIVLLLNFFRGIPRELEESAFMDGASHWTSLWRIYVPLAAPALATLVLFSSVTQWNAWFDGIIYMKSPDQYPLSTYLQTVVINPDIDLTSSTDYEAIQEISSRTLKAAQIFLGALPILLVYPFLQKYFVKGMVLGSVKE